MEQNYFTELNTVDCSDKIEKKNGLSYLSWAYAWGELKKRFPDAIYTVYENPDGWNYFSDGRTAWVKTGVTVNGIEHIEYLPIMDFKNKSIPLGNITSFEVNKAIQRSLTKAVARHGLGLYIYAGEDLPDETDGKQTVKKATSAKKPVSGNEAPKSYRDLLRDFCSENYIDPKTVVQICGLNRDSTEEDYKNALEYAKSTLGA
jgi:hypothetical protein